jgi:hypothetical protein
MYIKELKNGFIKKSFKKIIICLKKKTLILLLFLGTLLLTYLNGKHIIWINILLDIKKLPNISV